MDERSNDREREIFEESLELPSEERSGFIQRICGDDRELEDRVRRLLLAHERAIQMPALHATTTISQL